MDNLQGLLSTFMVWMIRGPTPGRPMVWKSSHRRPTRRPTATTCALRNIPSKILSTTTHPTIYKNSPRPTTIQRPAPRWCGRHPIQGPGRRCSTRNPLIRQEAFLPTRHHPLHMLVRTPFSCILFYFSATKLNVGAILCPEIGDQSIASWYCYFVHLFICLQCYPMIWPGISVAPSYDTHLFRWSLVTFVLTANVKEKIFALDNFRKYRMPFGSVFDTDPNSDTYLYLFSLRWPPYSPTTVFRDRCFRVASKQY